MEHRFRTVQKQLDDLGYLQILVPDSLPLVEKLVLDLIQTTESLQKYKEIAKDAIEERDNLRLGAEPYKCDNAKLVKECNDLHLTFLQFRERNEKLQKDLKRRIASLEREKLECYSTCEELKEEIKSLQVQSATRYRTLGGKATAKSSSTFVSKSKSSADSKSNTELNTTAMALANQKITNLTKEIRKLKEEQLGLIELNEVYKNQLNNRDREIERLGQMLEGGRPIQALNQDCCYKDVEGKLFRMQNEISCLEKEKSELGVRLKDAVAKQHEAMKRALSLADRNKQLELELRDIDQMALTVEADCNTTVKNNAEKLNRLQAKVHETVLQIQTLEREVIELKRDKQELLSDLDALKIEKKHLQNILETALEDKKRLNDKMNQFTIIEHDLNLEIDRLVQASASQKRKIAELEGKLFAGKLSAISDRSVTRDSSPNNNKSASPTRPDKQKPAPKSPPPVRSLHIQKMQPQTRPQRTLPSAALLSKRKVPLPVRNCCKNKPPKLDVPNNSPDLSSLGSFRTPSPEPNFDNGDKTNGKCCRCCNRCKCCNNSNAQVEPSGTVDHFRTERDYYMKEYHRVLEQMKNIPDKPDNNTELLRKLSEHEQLIGTLQHDNKTLAQEKHNLMTRLETVRDRADADHDSLSLKSAIRRLERERDILKGDITRLEEERDATRQRLKVAMEAQVTEHARMEKTVMDSEEQVKRLEQERRDLMQNQGSRRATISSLEEQCNTLRDQLRLCQTELNHQRTLYIQLKTLQEQTDKALADSQAQLTQAESELDQSQKRVRGLERDRSELDQEVAKLKNDVILMKGSLAQIDQEKDSLLIAVDDKTERMATLEQELRAKDNKLLTLESSVAELKKKLSLTIDSSSSREQLLRNASAETASLREELETALRARDGALKENRRLQDDVASCTADCRRAQNELELAKRQIEDLKRQLQHYVAEVKRFEDLITQKEMERTELLDQFHSLSQEASMLENNNHTLENEAQQSKVQLSVTLDHVTDLETKITAQDDIIGTYEKQITELTSQISNMDSQLAHYRQQQERTEVDLATVRDLCVKLDKQKENLKKELNDKDDQNSQINRDVLRLRRESESMQTSLTKDRTSIESLEHLLAESRQESVRQKIINEELEAEILSLRQKIDEYQSRLLGTTEQLDFYQQKALDYSQQNKQLRRDVANERSPTTATFTYSANIVPGPAVEKKSCKCCAGCVSRNSDKNANRGDVIDVAAAVVASGAPQACTCKCCGGKTEPKSTSRPSSTENSSGFAKGNQSRGDINYRKLLWNDGASHTHENDSSKRHVSKHVTVAVPDSRNHSCSYSKQASSGVCLCDNKRDKQFEVGSLSKSPRISEVNRNNMMCTFVSSVPTKTSGYEAHYTLVKNDQTTQVKSSAYKK